MITTIPNYLTSLIINPRKTILGQLYLQELEAFQTKCLQTMVSPTSTDNTNYYINRDTMGTLVPVNPQMESFINITTKRRPFEKISYEYIFKNVTKKILTLSQKYSFEQALVEINKFREKAGIHFYGAVLRQNEKLINPFHILTPISYLKDKSKFSGEFTVLLFFYSKLEALSKEFKLNDKKEEEYCQDLLNNILKCSNHQDVEIKVPSNIEGFYSTSKLPHIIDRFLNMGSHMSSLENLNYHVLQGDEISEEEFLKTNIYTANENTKNSTFLLAAHQIMVNGIFAPEYGVSLLKKTSSSLHGTYITPSASCNIQSESLRPSLTYSSVCTGRESQRTLQGISSLHCSNYASAYNSQAHSPLSIIFARTSIQVTTGIYDKLGLLPKILKDEPSQEELERLGSFTDYITYMVSTYNLSLIEIEERYHKIKGNIENEKEKEFIKADGYPTI